MIPPRNRYSGQRMLAPHQQWDCEGRTFRRHVAETVFPATPTGLARSQTCSYTSRMRRGRNYSTLRRLGEGLAKRAYAFSWPGRLWARIPGATTVTRVEHTLHLARADRPPLRMAFA